MAENNVGRMRQVKIAFIEHLLKGIEEIQPITQQLTRFKARDYTQRLRAVPSRMVDDVSKMLESFWTGGNENGQAIDAELPVMFIAFGKNDRPAPENRGYPFVRNEVMQLSDDSGHYQVRLPHREYDVQIVFVAHEHESAMTMMDYVSMYFNRFENHRWPIEWHYDGHDFQTFGMFDDGFEPEALSIDLPVERSNICIFSWNFAISFMKPYIQGGNEALIDTVGMQITPVEKSTLFGFTDEETENPNGNWNADIGDWNP